MDWKTSAKRPRPGWLIQRLQTRVYRYLLVRAGAALNGGQPLRPEQIEMIYWFANFPDEPERLRYDATQFEADGRYLMEMAAEITQRDDEVFPLTDDVKRCLFCAYRSLCCRGVEAGDLDAADADPAAGGDRVVRLGREFRLRAGGGDRVLTFADQTRQVYTGIVKNTDQCLVRIPGLVAVALTNPALLNRRL